MYFSINQTIRIHNVEKWKLLAKKDSTRKATRKSKNMLGRHQEEDRVGGRSVATIDRRQKTLEENRP